MKPTNMGVTMPDPVKNTFVTEFKNAAYFGARSRTSTLQEQNRTSKGNSIEKFNQNEILTERPR